MLLGRLLLFLQIIILNIVFIIKLFFGPYQYQVVVVSGGDDIFLDKT